ncbi:uncharacterized protein psda isoform X1 [Nothobranchius furzeri]|uniref:Pleckstrin and Sec7 domain containing n=2 Tax=Nothobranchius furzeri TaxID=105023 RepID=A0A1A8AR29_NOTFU|nr:transcript variant X2 [Nothobranchius furzeri]KAF7221261.1 transcript variant X1 [Nothobranchius furzeri]
MSQPGKVLHLYMEVRAVSEDDGKLPSQGDNGTNQLMLQCSEVLTNTQRNSFHSCPNHRPNLSPVMTCHSGSRKHSLPPSNLSSRQSVSFQHQTPQTSGSPSHFQQQDVLYDGFGQLLEALAPSASNSSHQGSDRCTTSPEMDVYHGKAPISQSSSSCRWLTVPSPTNSNCSFYEDPEMVDEKGRTSVVSFGYIEKGSVSSMARQHNDTSRFEGLPAHLQKRMSDPVSYNNGPTIDENFNHHPHQSRTDTPRGSPYLSRATMDAVARNATHRALEEFGSPELRRRFTGHSSQSCSPTLPHHSQSSHCRSWGGSPVPPCSTHTLPSKTELLQVNRNVWNSSINGLPRSPASDHLCAQVGDSPHSFFSTSAPLPHSPTQNQQRHWVAEDSSSLSNKLHPALPAGRPTDIQHQIPTRTFSSRPEYQIETGPVSVNSINTTDYSGFSSNEYLNTQSHYPSSRCSSRTSDADSIISRSRSISPSVMSELDCKVSAESNKMYSCLPRSHTPSPSPSHAESLRSESPKSSGSFPKKSLHWESSTDPLQVENQNHRTIDKPITQTRPGRISPLMYQKSPSAPASPAVSARHVPASPFPVLDPQNKRNSSPSNNTLHSYQPLQYSGDHKLPDLEHRKHNHLFDRSPRSSPEVNKKCSSSQNSEDLPVGWTSKQWEWKEVGPVQDRGQTCEGTCRQTSARVNIQSKRDARSKEVQKHSAPEYQTLGLEKSTDKSKVQDPSGSSGSTSQSFTGVTGSLDISLQLDKNESLSLETSSQSSHGTADGSSGIQLDSSSTSTPSSRSQKIAQAKWDFLFGSQVEDVPRSKEAPAAPPPTSCLPSPALSSSVRLLPASQRRGWDSKCRRSSHHEVRQIEVELVTPFTRGPAPETGIIRRSIKYSETDLDAVPLRCYRETDLDEVMRAESESAEEVDSAFGSNRSVLENSISPEDSVPKLRTSAGKEENGEEFNDEEEGVASWASVRMHGDKRRQRAAKEEEDVLSLLLKGTLEASSDVHGGLKSPISIGSPRRPSDNNLDTFSRHFETIMESHRAKGTSYSSLDSVDLLTCGSTSVFTFDLPTLTPEIQSQICESAKQIMELSFAPLACSDTSSRSETSRSEISLSTLGTGFQEVSKDESGPPVRSRSVRETWRHSILKEGFRKASSVPSLDGVYTRECSENRPPELLYPQADVAERLALGSIHDALTNGMKPDLQAAKRLAKRLYNLDGFRKSDVAPHLGKNNEFSQMVAQEYLCYFNFSGLTIDQALRMFLTQFALMGETQERERVLAHFSRRYRQCNPEGVSTEDSVHTLTCAVMLLNTDLHGNNVGKRMSCSQFISNLEGLNDGNDFPKDLLKTLYSSIKNEKLQWTIDEEELRKSMSELAEVRTDSASHTMKRLGSSGNPLVGVAQQADGELYKSGFLVRKVHADPDGKRTPRGKRGWKSFYAMLKGLVLYLQKDEYRSERELKEEDVRNAVSIHHSLAMRAADYSKRPNVFYLRTADWRVFLFQAPNTEQMQSWITRINVVAAMFSAPPFPAAIGSQKRFSRPLLPGSNTKLSQEEQLKSHENRFRAVSSELVELTASTPDRKVKGRELEEQKFRKEYLEFEKTRYGTYAMLLRAKMANGDEDLSAFESRLFSDSGLQRAHSSPSLAQDKEKARGTKTSKSLKVTSSSTSGTKSGSRKNSGGNNQRAELQKQSSKQEEA